MTTTSGADGGASGEGGMAGMAGAAGAGGAAELSDEEVLHAARTANLGEVEQAEIALMRADDPDVVEFAETMLEDHSEAASAAEELADVEDLTFRPNPVSAMLRAESNQIIAMLEAASDSEFDLVYMNAQVAAHEEVSMLLSNTLIPEAENAALESYLVNMRTHVSTHLASAESIVDSLE